MGSHFSRILTLLRKERGISQKQAAADLNISQALLSHYEKGIRECGLPFLVRAADYYGVSCDYMLGRSPDRTGSQITVEDIPDPEQTGKENTMRGSILPILNKKLLFNSLNIVYDLLSKSANKSLINEVSSFLMLSVYRVLRVLHMAHPKNPAAMFGLPEEISLWYADAAMQRCEARAQAISKGKPVLDDEQIQDNGRLYITTDILSENYPLFAPSLYNVIQNAENKIGFE